MYTNNLFELCGCPYTNGSAQNYRNSYRNILMHMKLPQTYLDRQMLITNGMCIIYFRRMHTLFDLQHNGNKKWPDICVDFCKTRTSTLLQPFYSLAAHAPSPVHYVVAVDNKFIKKSFWK